jgi:hypothetical protein
MADLVGRGLDRRILGCDKANGENAACSAHSPLDSSAAVHRVVSATSAAVRLESEKVTPIRSDRP